ncbi:Arginine--tRNA ligase [Bienertia sinuspersici]
MQPIVHQAQDDFHVQATFKLTSQSNLSGKEGYFGESVILEPFDLPGMVLSYSTGHLLVKDHNTGFAEFLILEGLNGKNGTISLQTKEGCFLYAAGINNSTSYRDVSLNCNNGSSLDTEFKEAVSFILNQGLKSYHLISFMAKGLRRSYILEPLSALKDESYNVYFNITK